MASQIIDRGQAALPLSIAVDPAALDGRGRGLFFQSGEAATAESVNLMATSGRGLVSAALFADRACTLGLSPFARDRVRPCMPLYLVSVESSACKETGISAYERALTLNTLANPGCGMADLVTPGHIMPCVVPQELGPDSGLHALALHHVRRFGGSMVAAWCDILDEEGDLASAHACVALGQSLGVGLYIRRGADLISLNVLAQSRFAPAYDVGLGGLDFDQFA
jgi:3,4-dihydroxy 2-butanone 4-phosphate synthase / GTP cyclohydrolase II